MLRQKIWADLRLHKSRTVLAIISIAAGVFCVGALFGMIDLQLGRMDQAHRQSLPSHISMILNGDIGESDLQLIKQLPEIAGIDALTPLSVTYRPDEKTELQTGTIIFRSHPTGQFYDKTTLVSGTWPTEKQIAVERLSAFKTGLKAGDTINFETADGVQNLVISGIVRHPFVKPPDFGGQIHFFADAETATVFGGKTDAFRQLLAQVKPPYTAEKARTVAHDIRSKLSQLHIGVLVTLLQNPEEHWGRPFFTGINDILKIMALASLALACVLIFNTVAAHITQQTNQIGIIKSLGGSTWRIAKLYLTETFIIALIAVMLAIPLGSAVAYWSSCRLLGLFNIECEGFSYSLRALFFMVASGLIAPLLSALIPIGRGATMNLRAALSSYGLDGTFGTSRLDRWLERMGLSLLPAMYAAALGNLFRRKGRLVQTQIVLVIAGVLFMVLMTLVASVNLTLDNEMARSRYAVRLGFTENQDADKVIALMKSVAPTQDLELWQRFPVELRQDNKTLKQKGSLGIQMLALPADSRLYTPYIESGRWLSSADAGQRRLVISAETAQLNGLKAGDSIGITLGDTQFDWQIVGLYRWLAGGNYTVEPIYAPRETTHALLHHYDKSAFALLDAPIGSPEEEIDYLKSLKETFKNHDIKLDVYTTLAKLEQRRYARNQMKPLLSMLFGLAGLIAAIGGIGLSGTLAINVLQRTREIGVLSAIGAPAKAIYRLFLLEGLLHGLIAWAISIPLAYFAAQPIAQRLGQTLFGIKLVFIFDQQAVIYWLMLILSLAWLASYLPAQKAARLTIKECLEH